MNPQTIYAIWQGRIVEGFMRYGACCHHVLAVTLYQLIGQYSGYQSCQHSY
jgi:hypothetical protein